MLLFIVGQTRNAGNVRQESTTMKNFISQRINGLMMTAGLLLGLSVGTVFAQTNLIVNGSFETGSFSGWGSIGPADNNSDFGVAQSSVPPDVAEDGSYYAYFHGHPTDSSQDCLGQTVNLTVGAQYTITYYLGTDGTTLGSHAALWVVIGSSFGIDYSQDTQLTAYYPNSANALPYQKFTTVFTATNSNPILSFHGVDATSSILLDNVSMTLAPPPAPQLNVSVLPTSQLAFTWSSSTNGFLLQTNASLASSNWVTLTNQPVTVGSSNQIVLSAPVSNLFYRLTLP
jgi:hypothetical protein